MDWLNAFNDLRKKSNMSLDEISIKSGVPKGTLSKITSGITKNPSIETMKVLVHSMGYTLDDLDPKTKSASSLSEEAQKLAKGYDELDDHGKDMLEVVLSKETARMKRDSLTTVETEELWQYDEPVSAGDGTILGYMSGHKVVYTVSNTYTRKADYIVSVRGSSMEPRFYDNDLILVQETDDIEYGEVGIWYLDGRSYVKQKGHGRLISLNEMYRDVYMEEFSDCRCQGRVIGTLDPDWIVE